MSRLGMRLRVNREGEFLARSNSKSRNQCGTVGQRSYRYFVTIEATNKRLDRQGFVLDNALVHAYFTDCYCATDSRSRVLSCEEMAQRAVGHFVELLLSEPDPKRRIDLRRVYVRIHGSAVSFIEAEWLAEVGR